VRWLYDFGCMCFTRQQLPTPSPVGAGRRREFRFSDILGAMIPQARSLFASSVLVVSSLIASTSAIGQDTGKPPAALNITVPVSSDPTGPIATLHVFANLEQIPVLVLTPLRTRMKKPVEEARFRVSLDSGPPFRPTHVRREGDDPLAISILIDTTQPDNALLPRVKAAVEALGQGPLHAGDRVSVYSIECGLIRSYYDGPGDAALLGKAVDAVMLPWKERRENRHAASCKPSVPLWDSLAIVTAQLARLPGRRVVLAITDGQDSGSRTSWSDAMREAQQASIAVFGVVSEVPANSAGSTLDRGGTLLEALAVSRRIEDPFDTICESTGGIELPSSSRGLERQLTWAIQALRERYIIEFPRGDQDKPGRHDLNVTLIKTQAYVRPTGISMPLADPKLLANPLTIPGDPGKSPQLGTRTILATPQE